MRTQPQPHLLGTAPANCNEAVLLLRVLLLLVLLLPVQPCPACFHAAVQAHWHAGVSCWVTTPCWLIPPNPPCSPKLVPRATPPAEAPGYTASSCCTRHSLALPQVPPRPCLCCTCLM